MSILFPVLLTATMAGAPGAVDQPRPEVTQVFRMTLSRAVVSAAKREPVRVQTREATARQGRGGWGAPRGSRSAATRVTAIAAGAILGSLGGMMVGGGIDAATSNGECPTFMAWGMPIGAAVGGFLTAQLVR